MAIARAARTLSTRKEVVWRGTGVIRESPIVVPKATSALSNSKSQILPYLQDKELPACRTTAGTAWQCLLQVAEECACQKGAGAFVMLSCD